MKITPEQVQQIATDVAGQQFNMHQRPIWEFGTITLDAFAAAILAQHGATTAPIDRDAVLEEAAIAMNQVPMWSNCAILPCEAQRVLREMKSEAPVPQVQPSEALMASELPALQDGQSWCCGGCGSGEVKVPKRIDFEYSREEFPDSRVISKTIDRYVAPCCGGSLMMWSEALQDVIKWSYVLAAGQQADKPAEGM